VGAALCVGASVGGGPLIGGVLVAPDVGVATLSGAVEEGPGVGAGAAEHALATIERRAIAQRIW
jgi:hypothetical protein